MELQLWGNIGFVWKFQTLAQIVSAPSTKPSADGLVSQFILVQIDHLLKFACRYFSYVTKVDENTLFLSWSQTAWLMFRFEPHSNLNATLTLAILEPNLKGLMLLLQPHSVGILIHISF